MKAMGCLLPRGGIAARPLQEREVNAMWVGEGSEKTGNPALVLIPFGMAQPIRLPNVEE